MSRIPRRRIAWFPASGLRIDRLAHGSCVRAAILLAIVVPGPFSWLEGSPPLFAMEDPGVIHIDRPLHFLHADGTDVVVAPAAYQVSALQDRTLQLTSPSGTATSLSAIETTHTEALTIPRALLIRGSDDLLHIVLALPNGLALEAVGSPSGVRSRGGFSSVGTARINQSLSVGPVAAVKTAPAVTLSPPQGPSGTMVKITVSHFPLPPTQAPQMREAEVKLDNISIQTVTLLPCSNGQLGLGEDCGTPPLMVKMDGPVGGKKTVTVETSRNMLLGSPSAHATFTIDAAAALAPPILAVLSLSLAEGPSGSLVEVSACGFPVGLLGRRVTVSVDGQPAGGTTLNRCQDGSAGFPAASGSVNSMSLVNRIVISLEGPPGLKTIQAQVESSPGPVGTARFNITPQPAVAYSPRFQIVLSGTAVLDKETGLTWERFPEAAASDTYSFQASRTGCRGKQLGGRIGWRLPTLDEISSLVERGPAVVSLPAGHPFLLPQQTSRIWTLTGDLENAGVAYSLDIRGGTILPQPKSGTFSAIAWCVRGIPGPERQ